LDFDENNDVSMFVPLNDLVGAVNNWYKIIPLYNDIDLCGTNITMYSDDPHNGSQGNDVSYGHYLYYFDIMLHPETELPIFIYDASPTLFLFGDLNASNCSGTITLLVTSEN
jgi:hypothetical protein